MINLALEEGKGKIHIYCIIPGSILLQYEIAPNHRETPDITEIQGSCYQGVYYEPVESYQMLPKHNILLTHFLSILIPFLIILSVASNCVQLFQGQTHSIIFFFFGGGTAQGLHCCAWAFSSCGEQGPLMVAVRSPEHVPCTGEAKRLPGCTGSSCPGTGSSICGARV